MRTAVLIALFLLCMVTSGWGYGYLDAIGDGTPVQGCGAASVGMAGVGFTAFGDPSALVCNPASIAGIESTAFSLSFGPGIGTETITDSTGKHDHSWLALGNLSLGISTEIQGISVGAALVKISDFSFTGTHYTYDYQPGHADDISEIRKLTVTGGIYEAAGGISAEVFPSLRVGVSAGYRFGGITYDSTFTDIQDPANDTTLKWTDDIGDAAFRAGLEVPLSSATLGASWASSTERVPGRILLGGVLHLGQSGDDGLGIQVDVTDPGGDNDMGVTGFGFTSISQTFLLRGGFGLGFRNDDSVKHNADIELAMGAGLRFGGFILDFACSWCSGGRDSQILGSGTPDAIDQSRTVVALGLGLSI